MKSTHVHNIILGAGPAGLQTAYYLGARSQDYVVLERADHPGVFFERHPRHRKLLSINKRYTGYSDLESRRRYDWNSLLGAEAAPQFTDYSDEYFPDAGLIPRYLSDFERYHQLNVRYGFSATEITRDDTGFKVRSATGEMFTCDRLFVATGLAREHVPDIPGREWCKTYDSMPLDPKAYTDHRVLIVGKGNSAFETAEALINSTRKIWVCGPNTVRLAWATHYVGDLRAVNNNFLDTYQLKAQNNILDGALRSVRQGSGNELIAEIYFESRKRSFEYVCDDIILCTGFRFDSQVYGAGAEPTLRHCGRLPLMTCEWESVNVPNMYFVGTLMQSRDYHKTMSGFIHGFRHNIEALDLILQCKEGKSWGAQQSLDMDARPLSELLVERLSTSAPLLLQPGFIVDVVVVNRHSATLKYLRDVPMDYAMERLLPSEPLAYAVSLEYKKLDHPTDPFAMPRGVGVAEDFYLHPVLRRYEHGQYTGRLFLPDDLDNDWRAEEEHARKLQTSFETEFSDRPGTVPRDSFVAELSPQDVNSEEARSA